MKKVFSILVIFALMFTGVPVFATGDDEEPNRDEMGNGTEPSLLITNVEMPEVISKGEKFDVVYTLMNNGVGNAFDLTYDFDVENYLGSDPFTIMDVPKQIEFNTGATKTIGIRVKAADDAHLGDYKLFLKINYKNKYGISKTPAMVSRTIKIDLGKNSPELLVNNVTVKNDTSGRYNVGIAYENMGEKDAKNLTVTFNGGSNFNVVDTSNKKYLDDLRGKGNGVVNFLIEEKDSKADNIATLDFTFEDENKAKSTQSLTINIPLEDFSGDSVGKTPLVIINKYTLSKERILAGNKVNLSLFVENTNHKEVKNIKISLGVIKLEDNKVGGTVFSPVNSSNTFFVDRISGKTVYKKDIELLVDPNAQAKTYIVPVTIQYEDLKGKQLSAEELINIPITQSAKLDVLSLKYPKEATIGMPVTIASEFVNVGKVDLTNFRVNLEGEFEKENALYYVGNLEKGVSDFYQGTLIPGAEGEIKGIVVYSYTGSDNEEVRVEKEIAINVAAAPEPELGPEGMPIDANANADMMAGGEFGDFEKEEPTNYLAYGLGAIIVVLLFIIWRMKKNNSKEDFYE